MAIKSKHRSVKAMLREIRTFLEDETIKHDTRRGMWHILSALRGPDEEGVSWDVKDATTAVIRYHSLGIAPHYLGAIVYEDTEEFCNIRKSDIDGAGGNYAGGSHFQRHIYLAFEALGLKLREVNK